jgi:hypothetical protein
MALAWHAKSMVCTVQNNWLMTLRVESAGSAESIILSAGSAESIMLSVRAESMDTLSAGA